MAQTRASKRDRRVFDNYWAKTVGFTPGVIPAPTPAPKPQTRPLEATVIVSQDGGELLMETPYYQDFVRELRAIPGTRMVGTGDAVTSGLPGHRVVTLWRIPVDQRANLWHAMRRSLPTGTVVAGTRGTVTL